MIKTMSIFLHTIDDVKNFVALTGNMEGKVSIVGGRYRVDAKSIMGIFVLNLSVPLNLVIEKWKDEYETALQPYWV